jgi:hypothetical protein
LYTLSNKHPAARRQREPTRRLPRARNAPPRNHQVGAAAALLSELAPYGLPSHTRCVPHGDSTAPPPPGSLLAALLHHLRPHELLRCAAAAHPPPSADGAAIAHVASTEAVAPTTPLGSSGGRVALGLSTQLEVFAPPAVPSSHGGSEGQVVVGLGQSSAEHWRGEVDRLVGPDGCEPPFVAAAGPVYTETEGVKEKTCWFASIPAAWAGMAVPCERHGPECSGLAIRPGLGLG